MATPDSISVRVTLLDFPSSRLYLCTPRLLCRRSVPKKFLSHARRTAGAFQVYGLKMIYMKRTTVKNCSAKSWCRYVMVLPRA